MKTQLITIQFEGRSFRESFVPVAVQRACRRSNAYERVSNKLILSNEFYVAAVFCTNSRAVADLADQIRHGHEKIVAISDTVVGIHLLAMHRSIAERWGGPSIWQLSAIERHLAEADRMSLLLAIRTHPLIVNRQILESLETVIAN